jgi:hypothetical protein
MKNASSRVPVLFKQQKKKKRSQVWFLLSRRYSTSMSLGLSQQALQQYGPAYLTYFEAKLRNILKQSTTDGKLTMGHSPNSNKPLLRSGFEGYRYVCNVCLTSIFNYHYVYAGCAMDVSKLIYCSLAVFHAV